MSGPIAHSNMPFHTLTCMGVGTSDTAGPAWFPTQSHAAAPVLCSAAAPQALPSVSQALGVLESTCCPCLEVPQALGGLMGLSAQPRLGCFQVLWLLSAVGLSSGCLGTTAEIHRSVLLSLQKLPLLLPVECGVGGHSSKGCFKPALLLPLLLPPVPTEHMAPCSSCEASLACVALTLMRGGGFGRSKGASGHTPALLVASMMERFAKATVVVEAGAASLAAVHRAQPSRPFACNSGREIYKLDKQLRLASMPPKRGFPPLERLGVLCVQTRNLYDTEDQKFDCDNEHGWILPCREPSRVAMTTSRASSH